MKNGFLIYISIVLLLSSCGPGIGDVTEDLGNVFNKDSLVVEIKHGD